MSGALAIIFARAGSKGVPGKNLRPVGGRPCVMWTIDAAKAATLVTRVALSTDCPEMQRLALGAGIDVVVRPPALAGDTVTVDDAARHAVDAIERASGSIQDVAILYGNVPVRPEGLIDRALTLLRDSGADSVQSYVPVGKHHPWWTAVVDERSGAVRPWEGDVLNHGVFRRQDKRSLGDGADALDLRRVVRAKKKHKCPRERRRARHAPMRLGRRTQSLPSRG